MPKDRDNHQFSNRWVAKTIQVLAVLCQNAPECCLASDIAQILEIPVAEAEEILINLCLEEIARETEHGFQTIGNEIKKLDKTSEKVLNESLADFYEKMPKIRDKNGSWIN